MATRILNDMTKLGYIKNKDGKACNPKIYTSVVLDLESDTVTLPEYSVSAFDNKETYGYFRKTYSTYKEAKQKYDSLIQQYHTP